MLAPLPPPRPYKAVFDVFKEVRRPQVSLVRDLVSAVMHPTVLGMPELNAHVPGDAAVEGSTAEGSTAGTAQPRQVRRRDKVVAPRVHSFTL